MKNKIKIGSIVEDMRDGEIGEVIQTNNNYSIIKSINHKNSTKTIPALIVENTSLRLILEDTDEVFNILYK